MSSSERNACIEHIAALPGRLEPLLRGLTAAQLSAHYLPNEWSAAQNVHHLFDSHANSYVRCKLILTEDKPLLKGYDQEAWARLSDGCDADVADSLALLRALHARWVRFWRALGDGDFARTGIHSENGSMSLDEILRLYATHGEAHIDQIMRTLAAGGIAR